MSFCNKAETEFYYCIFHMKETLIGFIEDPDFFMGKDPCKFSFIAESEAIDKVCCVANELGNCTAQVKWKLMLD